MFNRRTVLETRTGVVESIVNVDGPFGFEVRVSGLNYQAVLDQAKVKIEVGDTVSFQPSTDRYLTFSARKMKKVPPVVLTDSTRISLFDQHLKSLCMLSVHEAGLEDSDVLRLVGDATREGDVVAEVLTFASKHNLDVVGQNWF